MRFTLFLALGATAAAANQHSYLTWLADTFIDKGVKSDFGYQDAVLYLGFQKAYELTSDERYFDWYKNQIDGDVVLEDGSINKWNYSRYVLDEYRMGNNYLYLYEQTGEDKYRSAAGVVRHMLNVYPRSPSGAFWHQQFFPNQMWLDGLYMAETFYARWTHHFDRLNVTAWDDILRQYSLIETHAHHPDGSGLLVHGWADGYAPWADPATGRAPHVWGRAVGWYFMSLVEVLGYFPLWHPGYWRLLRAYTSLARAVKAARDRETGSWWQVMEEENRAREGNFVEASASAMFTWGMFRGVRLGLLSGREFLGTARDAYGSLVDNFVSVGEDGGLVYEGTVDECNLANGDVNWDYYTSRPIVSNHQNGCGPFMLASYEWETWARDA